MAKQSLSQARLRVCLSDIGELAVQEELIYALCLWNARQPLVIEWCGFHAVQDLNQAYQQRARQIELEIAITDRH
mgnify:CR=1 FL=1